ncbi:hypothetical protein [Mycobacterium uberis]|uniref:hypothetical protein n=1 Tax=Mycobacterium uberis TaxID=2162698 RepID=UPI001401CF8B|nr:hypothetical protein [Mycobacterium uberis]
MVTVSLVITRFGGDGTVSGVPQLVTVVSRALVGNAASRIVALQLDVGHRHCQQG